MKIREIKGYSISENITTGVKGKIEKVPNLADPSSTGVVTVGDKRIEAPAKDFTKDAQGNVVFNMNAGAATPSGQPPAAEKPLQPGTDISINTGEPIEQMGSTSMEEAMQEISPKLARYYLRKIDAGADVTDLINDSAELHTMYNDAALMHHLHPDDDFEKIEQIVINDLNDIADSDYEDDFYNADESDVEQADEYEFESIKRLAGL